MELWKGIEQLLNVFLMYLRYILIYLRYILIYILEKLA